MEVLNGLPIPMVDVKDSDDCIIQELNGERMSNRELAYCWHRKMCLRFKTKLAVIDGSNVAEDILKEYTRSLKEYGRHLKAKKELAEYVSNHLMFFHSLHYPLKEPINLYTMNYLDLIENVVVHLCNVLLESVRNLNRNHIGKEFNKAIKKTAQKIIYNISSTLEYSDTRICHVLLKLNLRMEPPCRNVMDIVYKHFLVSNTVQDFSDLGFCRHYLLFQRWKVILDKSQHITMDKVLYLRFHRTCESIATTPVLKSILYTQANRLINMIDVLTHGAQAAVNVYFKHMVRKKEQESAATSETIELLSDEEEANQTLPSERGQSKQKDNGEIKSEKQNRAPVPGSVHYQEIVSGNGDVLCVIDDDDSEVEEVPQASPQKFRRKQRSRKFSRGAGYLNSIILPVETPSKPAVSAVETETIGPPTPAASPTPHVENTFPVVTAQIIAVQTNTDTSAINSLPVEGDAQNDPVSVTNILDSVTCATGTVSKSNNKTVASDVTGSTQDICVQSDISSQLDNHVTSNVVSCAVQSVHLCSCCTCKASTNNNINIKCNSNVQSEVNTNKSVNKPTVKTVEIQTETLDNFNYLCGMVTPPSDRTVDGNSPSCIENICSETDIHNDNGANRNVYAYVPSMTSSSESEVETPNDSSVYDSSAKHYGSEQAQNTNEAQKSLTINESSTTPNFDAPKSIQEDHASFSPSSDSSATLHSPESSTTTCNSDVPENIPKQQDVTHNSSEICKSSSISDDSTQPENVAKKQNDSPIARVFAEIADEILAENANDEEPPSVGELDGGVLDIRLQFDEGSHMEVAEPVGVGATEYENEFGITYIGNSLGLIEPHTVTDESGLVTDIELHYDCVPKTSPGDYTEIDVVHEDEPILEMALANEGLSDRNDISEGEYLVTTSEEYQTNNSVEASCATVGEPEGSLNNVIIESSYTELVNLPPFKITDARSVGMQETIAVVPYNLINTVILDNSNTSKKNYVFIPSVSNDNGDPTKVTVHLNIGEENFMYNEKSNKGDKNSCLEQEAVVNEKEPSAAMNQEQCKIQASVTMKHLADGSSTKRKNGELTKRSSRKNGEDKILFTSNERVTTAPLSVFSKFEQAQSDLVENAFSGPVEPISSKPNAISDNSNDSFILFDSERSSVIRDVSVTNSPEMNWPSPPYEDIFVQEFKNHLETAIQEDRHMQTSSKTIERKHENKYNNISAKISQRKVEKQFNNSYKCREQTVVASEFSLPVTLKEKKRLNDVIPSRHERRNNSIVSIMSNKSMSIKRKRSDYSPSNKRVHFGDTAVRYVHKYYNVDIPEATFQYNNVRVNDDKLLNFEPIVFVHKDSAEDIEEKRRKVQRDFLFARVLFEKRSKAESSCIVKRVDYNKPFDNNSPKPRHLDGWSNINHLGAPPGPSGLSAVTKQADTHRMSTLSPPSGYVPALTAATPGVLKNSDNSEDNEAEANNSGRRRSRRTQLSKELQQAVIQLPKISDTPTCSTSTPTPTKRPRGRPRKTETAKSPKNVNQNVSYSEGPFRLG